MGSGEIYLLLCFCTRLPFKWNTNFNVLHIQFVDHDYALGPETGAELDIDIPEGE